MITHIIKIQAKTYIPALIIGVVHIFLPFGSLIKTPIDGTLLIIFSIWLINSNREIENKINCIFSEKPKKGLELFLVILISLLSLVILSIPMTLIVLLFISTFNHNLLDIYIGILASLSWLLILIINSLMTTKYCICEDGIYVVSGIWNLDLKYINIKAIHYEPHRITLFPYPIFSERIPWVYFGTRMHNFICIETKQLFYSKIYLTPSQGKSFINLIEGRMGFPVI